ncbi:TRAP transporter small permease [Azospirillum sp.]|uniref:TRAP transporter small permease subunit n=1 Tax=Azospirillum sp. TaxID=34012 RepID=UPI002D388B5B|nr:TRAP transporter small permease [Azospirillum sp.]HYD69143.1 TRAP transporter small permease [Azospirillum sp.]
MSANAILSLSRWVDRLGLLGFWAGSVGLAAMMLHITADVAGRFLLNAPITGTLEIVSTYYMIAVSFLPLGFIQSRRYHIEVELFTQHLSGRALAVVEAFAALLGLAIFLGIAVSGAFTAWANTVAGEAVDATLFDITVWPTRWFLVFGCAAAALAAFAAFLDRGYHVLHGHAPADAGTAAAPRRALA